MEEKFYCYIYLNPLKEGVFSYNSTLLGEINLEYEPFYVGKGKNQRFNAHMQKREIEKMKNKYRKKLILSIIKSNLEPIILTTELYFNEDDAYNIESHLVELIGRKDLNKGPLTNLTDGGKGTKGQKTSKEILDRISSKLRGRKLSEDHKIKLKEDRKLPKSYWKPVYQYTLDGIFFKKWDSIALAAKSINIKSADTIAKVTSGRLMSCGGFNWKSEFLGDKIDPIIQNDRSQMFKKVGMYDKNKNLLKSFDSLTEASTFVQCSPSNLTRAINNTDYSCKGYKWGLL